METSIRSLLTNCVKAYNSTNKPQLKISSFWVSCGFCFILFYSQTRGSDLLKLEGPRFVLFPLRLTLRISTYRTGIENLQHVILLYNFRLFLHIYSATEMQLTNYIELSTTREVPSC
jgi:hypothetical protein